MTGAQEVITSIFSSLCNYLDRIKFVPLPELYYIESGRDRRSNTNLDAPNPRRGLDFRERDACFFAPDYQFCFRRRCSCIAD